MKIRKTHFLLMQLVIVYSGQVFSTPPHEGVSILEESLQSHIVYSEEEKSVLKAQINELFEIIKNQQKELENQKLLNQLISKNEIDIAAQYKKIDYLDLYTKNSIPELEKKYNELELLLNDFKESTQRSKEDFSIDLIRLDKKIDVIVAENIDNVKQNFNEKIKAQNTSLDQNFNLIQSDLIKNKKLGLVAATLLILLIIIVFFTLKIRIKNSAFNLESKIKSTRQSLEKEAIKLDSKLIDLLEKQTKLIDESQNKSNETDHSLAIKVADEIIRIHNNLRRMDESTKGLKQLSSAIKRIQDNFLAKGYEIIDMRGQDYHDGMKVIPTLIPTNELEVGQQIITRIIKPQINYQGQIIQMAEIEVSIGE